MRGFAALRHHRSTPISHLQVPTGLGIKETPPCAAGAHSAHRLALQDSRADPGDGGERGDRIAAAKAGLAVHCRPSRLAGPLGSDGATAARRERSSPTGEELLDAREALYAASLSSFAAFSFKTSGFTSSRNLPPSWKSPSQRSVVIIG